MAPPALQTDGDPRQRGTVGSEHQDTASAPDHRQQNTGQATKAQNVPGPRQAPAAAGSTNLAQGTATDTGNMDGRSNAQTETAAASQKITKRLALTADAGDNTTTGSQAHDQLPSTGSPASSPERRRKTPSTVNQQPDRPQDDDDTDMPWTQQQQRPRAKGGRRGTQQQPLAQEVLTAHSKPQADKYHYGIRIPMPVNLTQHDQLIREVLDGSSNMDGYPAPMHHHIDGKKSIHVYFHSREEQTRALAGLKQAKWIPETTTLPPAPRDPNMQQQHKGQPEGAPAKPPLRLRGIINSEWRSPRAVATIIRGLQVQPLTVRYMHNHTKVSLGYSYFEVSIEDTPEARDQLQHLQDRYSDLDTNYTGYHGRPYDNILGGFWGCVTAVAEAREDEADQGVNTSSIWQLHGNRTGDGFGASMGDQMEEEPALPAICKLVGF